MIGIAQVLAKIDLSPINGPFSITFVKSDGSIRTIEKAQKGHKNGDAGGSQTSSFRYNIKQNGVVILADLNAVNNKDKFRTIKISRIIKFNGIKVNH